MSAGNLQFSITAATQSVEDHPINAAGKIPLPNGYTDWQDYYTKTGDWSIGPAITMQNPDTCGPVQTYNSVEDNLALVGGLFYVRAGREFCGDGQDMAVYVEGELFVKRASERAPALMNAQEYRRKYLAVKVVDGKPAWVYAAHFDADKAIQGAPVIDEKPDDLVFHADWFYVKRGRQFRIDSRNYGRYNGPSNRFTQTKAIGQPIPHDVYTHHYLTLKIVHGRNSWVYADHFADE